MTSYGAYDAGLPCKNPNCKSHGKPHPNCRCYGNMAEGGEVGPYCASGQKHRKDCRYFKAGGEVHPLDVPKHASPSYSVSAYLAHGGLHHLLKKKMGDAQQDLDHYNNTVERSHKLFDAKIESLFSGEKIAPKDHDKAKEAIGEWIDKGGSERDVQDEIYKQNAEPKAFAKGGEVKKEEGIGHNHHMADTYPEHNVLLQQAKGNVSNYLKGLKPEKNHPKLAFDDEPDNREQKKTYDKALSVAAHPLGVLDHVQKGTIEPEHVGHLKGLYPDLHDVVQQKLTQRITEAQLKGEKPSSRVRQGLSLLMGTPLSGELSPSNIMAAQATFQNKKAAQAGGEPQKKTSAIAKSSQSYLLPSQAAAERQQKQ